MTTKKPSILIGCVTYFKQAPVLDLLIESLKKLEGNGTNFSVDVLFVDNSPGDVYFKYLQKKLGDAKLQNKAMVAYDAPGTKNRIDRIITGRNIIRMEFLKNKDYTHLFFLDTDVIVPPETIIKLLGNDKPLVAGLYLARQQLPNGKTGVFPVGCVAHSPGKVRQLMIDEIWEPKIIEAAVTGLGCVLIRRDVLEKVSFRNIGDTTTGGEDTAFYSDARKAHFLLFIDTAIKCDHYFYPPDDERNALLMFSRYRKKGEQTDVSYSFSFGINAK